MRSPATMVESIPAERLCVGSHTPFYVSRSAMLKVQSSTLPQGTLARITVEPADW